MWGTPLACVCSQDLLPLASDSGNSHEVSNNYLVETICLLQIEAPIGTCYWVADRSCGSLIKRRHEGLCQDMWPVSAPMHNMLHTCKLQDNHSWWVK